MPSTPHPDWLSIARGAGVLVPSPIVGTGARARVVGLCPQATSNVLPSGVYMRARSLLASIVVAATFILAAGASAQSWRFVVAGDTRDSGSGVNTTILGEIANAALSLPPDSPSKWRTGFSGGSTTFVMER